MLFRSIILELQKNGIRHVKDYYQLLQRIQPKDHVLMLVKNRGAARFIVLVLDPE